MEFKGLSSSSRRFLWVIYQLDWLATGKTTLDSFLTGLYDSHDRILRKNDGEREDLSLFSARS